MRGMTWPSHPVLPTQPKAPKRTCTAEDLEEVAGLKGKVQIRGKKRDKEAEAKALVKRFRALPKDCLWLPFESLHVDSSVMLFSRQSLERELVAFMDLRKGAIGRS